MEIVERKPLILIGGGGHCKSVIDAALSAGLEIRGILDAPERVGETVLGIEIIGTDADIANYVADCDFIITVGQIKTSETRRRLAAAVKEAAGKFGVVIASTARVSPFARIGGGTVVLHGACVNADASVGRHSIVNTASVIEHDVRIGDFTHISTNASVNGAASIGSDCFVGSGAVVNQGVVISDRVILASASLANKSIYSPGRYAGIPAKIIK